jgi:hypothetical protein
MSLSSCAPVHPRRVNLTAPFSSPHQRDATSSSALLSKFPRQVKSEG